MSGLVLVGSFIAEGLKGDVARVIVAHVFQTRLGGFVSTCLLRAPDKPTAFLTFNVAHHHNHQTPNPHAEPEQCAPCVDMGPVGQH